MVRRYILTIIDILEYNLDTGFLIENAIVLPMELTQKDLEKLKRLLKDIEDGTATTYEKTASIEALKSILEPKCAVCRKLISEEMIVVNDRKLHAACRSKYKG